MQIKKQEKENNNNKAPGAKPVVTAIIVSTIPAEVIQTDGVPVYKNIDSTSLQYVSNSGNDILKTSDGTIYILLAGRWYTSSSFNGPWKFKESDKLPADFAKIPEGSDKDNVLVSVAGTNAAEEAIIDAEIPQTAKVDRKTATVKVEYDGEPKFENIEGTTLQLAANSNLTILKDANAKCFALDNGVWFVSNSAKGPWKVADTRPQDVEAIPAKSAAYNAKFVQVYETTPDYVIVGYTGGYLNNYVQGDPTIIFGTGYYYAPWYGTVYYPHPCTWGFNFYYNPWTGWTIGYTYNIGFLTIGFGVPAYGFGWFGPPLYHPPYHPPYYGGGYYGRPGGGYGNHYGNNNINININNTTNNIYKPGKGENTRPGITNRPNTNGTGSSYRPGSRPGVNNATGANNNGAGGNRPGGNNGFNWGSRPPKPSKDQNNVFTDKAGNIFQRDNKGNLNQRDNKSNTWRPSATPDNSVRRDVQSRERGASRSENFNRASSPSFNRPRGDGAKPSAGGSKPSGAGSRGKRG